MSTELNKAKQRIYRLMKATQGINESANNQYYSYYQRLKTCTTAQSEALSIAWEWVDDWTDEELRDTAAVITLQNNPS